MLLILLSFWLYSDTDQNTVFNEDALQQGQAIWQACKAAHGHHKLEGLSDVAYTVEVTGRTGNSWINEHQISLQKPRYTLTTKGSTYTQTSGFDGQLGWSLATESQTPPIPQAQTGQQASNAEEIRKWYQSFPVLLTRTFPVALIQQETIGKQSYQILRIMHPEDGSLLLDLWVSQTTHHLLKARVWNRIRRDGSQRSYIMQFKDYQSFAGLNYSAIWRSSITRKLLSLTPLDTSPDYAKPQAASYRKPRNN